MTTQILFRKSLAEENEYEAASKYFDVIECRTEMWNSLIIPRYSALPYYKELEQECHYDNKCKLIQSYQHHKWIADFEWYEQLEKYTFKTWRRSHNPQLEDIAYIIKGSTNSKKFSWNRDMYAPNKEKAYEIAYNLSNDSLIGQQDILFREYIPLKTYEVGANNLPFTAEWRLFFLKNQLIDHGYYWSIAEKIDYTTPKKVLKFAQKIAEIASQHTTFFVLDIALKEHGEDPILVEINCGTMSGLSCIDPDRFYKNLEKIIYK